MAEGSVRWSCDVFTLPDIIDQFTLPRIIVPILTEESIRKNPFPVNVKLTQQFILFKSIVVSNIEATSLLYTKETKQYQELKERFSFPVDYKGKPWNL